MSKNQTSDHESALIMNAYVDGISGHKSLFEQVGVRKVDFVDGVTPDLEQASPQEEGRGYVKQKKGDKLNVGGSGNLGASLSGPAGKGDFMILKKAYKPGQDQFQMVVIDDKGIITKDWGSHPSLDGAKKFAKNRGYKEETVREALDSDDKPTVKKVVKMLKKASQAHAGQADDLEKSMDEKMDGRKKNSGKQARDENERRRAAQRKRLGILGPNEEVEIDEKKSDYEDQIKAFLSKGGKVNAKKHSPNKKKIDQVIKDFKKKYKHSLDTFRDQDKKDFENYLKNKKDLGEEVELEEHCGECGAMDHVDEKKGSDYDLYHKTFSGAMQHAYAQAKKRGYVVDKDDIDSKVATGPRKPSMGKTNRYILGTDKKQKLHVQVANLDNKRYELNMYIEEADPQSDIKKKVEKTAIKVAKDVVKSEAHDPKDYAKKVAAVNKMFKVKSPKELSPDQKKKYFNTLDRMHKAKGEKPEIGEDNVVRLQKQIQRNNDRESKLKDKLAKEKQVTKTAKKMSTVGQAMRADVAPKSTGNTSASGTTTQSKPAKTAPAPKTQKPQSATMKNSFTPVGTFLEDTRVFMNGLWEKAAKEADGMDMSGPPPVMGKKTMTKKSQDKVEINPKEEE